MKKYIFLLMLAVMSAGLVSRSYAQSKVLNSIKDESDYYKFANMIRTANMDAALTALGTYTVFAPDNLLFREMGPTKLDSLTGDAAKMTAFLKAHIVKGKLTTAEISKKLDLGKGKATLVNLLGQPLTLTRTKDNKLLITGKNAAPAHFLAFDIKDAKSVVHGIDNVLVK